AAQPTRVDRERRFLDRPHVVQDVARSARKVRIAELDGTAVFGLLAFERFPRILDQPRNRLAGSYLRPDADHFDARDAVACVGRVVTLAAAQALYSLRLEAFERECGAAGFLLGASDRAYSERGFAGPRETRSHRRDGVVAAHQIEPQQDPLAAGRVDFPALERVPDRVAVAALGVQRHQAAGVVERRAALEIENLKTLEAIVLGIDRFRIGVRLAERSRPSPPERAARAERIGHSVPLDFLVAGAGPRRMIVARADESRMQPTRRGGIAEIGERERVLQRAARTRLEDRIEAVETLSAHAPCRDVRTGDRKAA